MRKRMKCEAKPNTPSHRLYIAADDAAVLYFRGGFRERHTQ